MYVAGATDAPCIRISDALTPKPVPTRVTVVPTEAEAGLTSVKAGALTVNPTELKVTPAETVWSPEAAAWGTVKVAVAAAGHAEAPVDGVATLEPSK